MCGIAGFFGLDDRALLKRMASVIAHRGPDHEGLYASKGIGLANRRLSIIDLAGGNQPIYDDTRRYVIVFNGEIYNYKELHALLEKKGVKFSTSSDTEVILYLLITYGIGGIGKLNGMFAFAWYDSKERKLIIARDRAGIKPLYYTVHKGMFFFGSEIKAILEHEEIPKQIDHEAKSSYLTFGTVLGAKTLFKGISKLLPGKYMEITPHSISIKSYPQEPTEVSSASLRQTLEHAVQSQMVADVPLGAFLSGGLDSSTIVGLMAKTHNQPVKTFTVGFGEESDEIYYARAVSEHIGTEHHERIVEPKEVQKTMEKLVWHFDDLTWDSASVPLFLVSELAKKHVKVVLSGEGADELFAGYERYRPFSPAIPLIPWNIRTAVYKKYITMFDSQTRARLGTKSSYADKVLDEYLSRSPRNLQNVLDFEYNEFLPHQLLNKADKATMAASIEGRVPFLDNAVIEKARHIPLHEKMLLFKGKAALRAAVKDITPTIARARAKQGFGAKPIFWLSHTPFLEYTKSMLADGHSKELGIDLPYAKHLIEEKSRPKRAYQVWSLLLLELWYRKFFGE